MMLKGVVDSPDIPNVSRSGLQADAAVKKNIELHHP
jgi:HSP90 family molecular chaperone